MFYGCWCHRRLQASNATFVLISIFFFLLRNTLCSSSPVASASLVLFDQIRRQLIVSHTLINTNFLFKSHTISIMRHIRMQFASIRWFGRCDRFEIFYTCLCRFGSEPAQRKKCSISEKEDGTVWQSRRTIGRRARYTHFFDGVVKLCTHSHTHIRTTELRSAFVSVERARTLAQRQPTNTFALRASAFDAFPKIEFTHGRRHRRQLHKHSHSCTGCMWWLPAADKKLHLQAYAVAWECIARQRDTFSAQRTHTHSSIVQHTRVRTLSHTPQTGTKWNEREQMHTQTCAHTA